MGGKENEIKISGIREESEVDAKDYESRTEKDNTQTSDELPKIND